MCRTQLPPCAGDSPWPWPEVSSDARAAQSRAATPIITPVRDAVRLSARQEIGESRRRWPPSTSPVPICTASGTTRSTQATAQRQRFSVAKLRGARDRKRATGVKVEGRKSHAELRLEPVRRVHRPSVWAEY